jgi:hypothetical protein
MKNTIFIVLSLILSFSVFSQADWELKKEEDGIKVYLREVDGSKIQEYKAEAILEGKVSIFVAVLKDVNSYKELYSHAKDVKLLNENDTFHVHYIVTDTPWPVKDRDAVYSSTYSQHYGTKTVRIDMKLEEGYLEQSDDCVRMENAVGFWLLNQIEPNKVDVLYQMHAEPGGSIPTWAVNMFLVDTPIEDIKMLQKRAKLDKYTNQKFDFLVE